eukprot:171222-Prymnesium_polylepis.1
MRARAHSAGPNPMRGTRRQAKRTLAPLFSCVTAFFSSFSCALVAGERAECGQAHGKDEELIRQKVTKSRQTPRVG